MNCCKLDYKILFSNLFISTIFLSDFGIVIKDQPIYFFQLLAFCYLTLFLINKPVIEKGWLIFFIFVFFSIIANVSLVFEHRQFAGDTYPWTSIKGFANVILFYAVFKTALYTHDKINPIFFLYLSIFMIAYGFMELLFSSNDIIREILGFFHTNPKALNKSSISLLGREPSYGSFGYILSALILLYFCNKNTFTGYKKLLVFICISLLIFLVIQAKSKSVYLSLIFLFMLLIFSFFRRKITYKSLFLIFFFAATILIVISNSIYHNYHHDIVNYFIGGFGSGSVFVRFSSLYIAFTIWLENPFFGVGIGNYKLFYVEHIYKSEIPIIYDLKILVDPNFSEGSIDPLNFFGGILSELGFFIFVFIFYFIFKKIKILLLTFFFDNRNIPLSVLITPIIFAASFSFYYWAFPFFPFFLAILNSDYKNYLLKK